MDLYHLRIGGFAFLPLLFLSAGLLAPATGAEVALPSVGQASPDDHWIPFGTWFESGTSDAVYSLLEFQGELLAGGPFIFAGREFVSSVARWDGTRWWPLGEGLQYENPVPPPCQGAECQPWVADLIVYENRLIAAGRFTRTGFQGRVPLNHVAMWDGTTWQPLGSGMDQPVWALEEFRGDLIAAGDITMAGGQPASGIARWDGVQWWPLGSGINGLGRHLAVFQDRLFVSGTFTRHCGGRSRLLGWHGVEHRG